ncbi:MarR family transcriptional regulator [Microbacterium oryzae]|uniref:MarR family winged helix-turn-helix transcriptional regulator n=1 Tax=Microbacterium oryzae TaxID=743009 RepID=UPI0025AEDC26|nr:MarR family transcriptional regulator [Microbacterium oryzae]MDN3311387.1 MarR family transcriptional regulator [Microbacterium oryzae]
MAETADPTARIATALSRLRLGRPGPVPAGDSPAEPTAPGEQGRPHHPRGAHAERGAHGHGQHHGEHAHGGRGPFGRSMARLRLLELLAAAEGPLSVGAIAERLGVDQPRASRLVQAVVESAHARREADPADARRTLIAVTEEGRALAARSHDARAEAVDQALAGFTAEERTQLADLLGRLADAWPDPRRRPAP